MRTNSIAAVAFCIFTAAPSAPAEIPWLKDLDLAKQEAAQKNKPLLIVFSADWAPPSVKLMKLLAASEFEGPITGSYVPVQIDYSPDIIDKPEGKLIDKLMESMKVDGIPTLIIADAAGKETTRLVGYGTDEKIRLWFAHKGDADKVFHAELEQANSASGAARLEKLNALALEVLTKLPVRGPLKDLFADAAAQTAFAEKITSDDESVREPARALVEKLKEEMLQDSNEASNEAAWQLTQAYAAQLKTTTDEDDKTYLKDQRDFILWELADQDFAQAVTAWVWGQLESVSSTGEFPGEAGSVDEHACRKWATDGIFAAKYLLGVFCQHNKNKGDPAQAEKLFREVIAQRVSTAPSSPASAPTTATATPSTSGAITLDDLISLLQAGTTSDELLAEIAKHGYSGATDVAALTALKKAGATTPLLLAVKKAAK